MEAVVMKSPVWARPLFLPLLLTLPLPCFVGTGCERIEKQVIRRQAARTLAGDRTEWLADGRLHVVLCGTGSPIADPERAAACTAVLAGGHFFLVDAGPGSAEQVVRMRLPRARLGGILLTHFHSDHIGDLGEMTVQSWIGGRTSVLEVFGPPGVERVVGGFAQAYASDVEHRVSHHGETSMPRSAGIPQARPFPLPAPGEAKLVFEADGLRVSAFRVDHEPVDPAVGYRFDFNGRSVVISGDTKKSASLVAVAKDADVLIHEALAAHMIRPVTEYAREQGFTRWAKLTADILDYHATPVEAAEVAREAGVRQLVITHIVPNLPNFLAVRMFQRGMKEVWDGPIELGADGLHLTLPPGSERIDRDSLL